MIEQFYFDLYKCYDRQFGYNINPTSDNSIKSEETLKQMFKLRKDRIKINNGINEKLIRLEDLEKYLNEGWNKGRIWYKNLYSDFT